jgi:hypothetical protein
MSSVNALPLFMKKLRDYLLISVITLMTKGGFTMAEEIFLNEGELLVTNARMNVAGQTYAVSNITSFKTVEYEPNTDGPDRFGGIGFLLGGLVWWGAASNSVEGGALLGGLIATPFFLISWLWRRAQKSTYSVILNTAAGEVQAVTSKDKDTVLKVASALGNAIVARA